MKLLALDVGNTRIKWGLHVDGHWLARGFLPTAHPNLLAGTLARLPGLDQVLGSNVAGEPVAQTLGGLLEACGLEAQWIRPASSAAGVANGYEQPAQLGPDRWAALVAAHALFEGPLLVVNAGTAVTVDALTRDGRFLGGLIAPGTRLMATALNLRTARLPLANGEVQAFPRNSADAITSGIVHSLCGAAERTRRSLELASGEAAQVILSGGGAGDLLPHFPADTCWVPALVLEGLVRLAGVRP